MSNVCQLLSDRIEIVENVSGVEELSFMLRSVAAQPRIKVPFINSVFDRPFDILNVVDVATVAMWYPFE
ncbi:hypothetical protein CHS0354_040697 [Potamilus streckersoni]|uniref:Uncharacterized protein n=1 Tax=Potamilus streckersoni TaxID=2493646 RepID=A0AAE0SL36_9BIVA|nr:hypothetical protein CHS0354_040697 [Potamilus streckersoni]